MVLAGAAAYFWVFTVAVGLAGHPAATATLLAAAWAVALAAEVAEVALVVVEELLVVVVVDLAALVGFLDLLLETSATIPMMMAAATTTMMTLRVVLRRFSCLACSASRASRPARWRALFSLGMARNPIRPRAASRFGGRITAEAGPGGVVQAH